MSSKRGSRRPRPQHQARRPGTGPASREHDGSGHDPDLIKDLRRALRSTEPLDFLSIVSGILELTDPRRRNPFSRGDTHATLEGIVESFIGTSYAETTAALTVIRALTADELLAARIGRELAIRRQPLPDWLHGLERAQVESDVWLMTDVLGDGDDYLVGVVLPSGHCLSALVYVDHNMGTVVKDAFVAPTSLREMAEVVARTTSDKDQSISQVDPATARAVVEDAIDHGARMWPPLESDDWPMCRPIVEWMVRMLPAGGSLPPRPEWTDEDRQTLADAFFASPFAAGLDTPDGRALLDSVLWFGTDYGPGDPLRWSPVNVEIVLTDWFPRKVLGEPAFLSLLPDLLRAFIRYSHGERAIRPGLTAETLVAVGQWEPDFQRAIRSARLQGAAALAARMLDDARDADLDDLEYEEIMLEALDETVGGRTLLMSLDASPLPDEEFEWAGVPEDIRPAVQSVLDMCDRVADELLDVEHRTAIRRFLSRVAVGDPGIFRRKASAARGAAAIAWVIARANDTVGSYWSGLSVQELVGAFGVTGSVSQRAEPMLRASGVDPHRLYGAMRLGAPDLLTSRKRASVIQARDRYLGERG